jgi:hypothetical protein
MRADRDTDREATPTAACSGLPAAMRWPVFALPLALCGGLVLLKVFDVDRYAWLVREDGPVENLQVLLLFAAAVVAVAAARRFAGAGLRLLAALWLVLAAGLFIVAMEEISWGQRLLGIETPESIAAINVQGELTLHNLEPLFIYLHTAYLVVGGYGMLTWLALPLLRPDPRAAWTFVVPNWYLTSWFLVVFVVYGAIELAQWVRPTLFGHQLVIGGFVRFRDQEPAELVLSAAFLVFAIDQLIRARRLPGAPAR